MSPPRTRVTFSGGFPSERRGPDPPGFELAEWVASRLRERGFEAGVPSNEDDYAYAFECRAAKERYWVTVGFMDDGPREWLICFDPRFGLLQRLLGHAGGAAQRDLGSALNEALKSTERVTDVRWYTNDEWDGKGELWSQAP